jgi:hypothetical protein
MCYANCLFVRAGVVALAVLPAIVATMALAAETKLPQSKAKPADLVQAALKTELDGPSASRETLLKQALELDPEFAPARWQLGFVRFDDEWLTLDEVAKRAASDETLREYRKRRDALVDTADNQREMARWCHRQKLADEARVHWAKVLEFDPQDAEALAALGLQLHEGRLLTKAQIEEAKKQQAEIRRATREWSSKLLKWRRAIESGSTKDRLSALQELQKLSDPNVIPVLEATFAEQQASKTGDARNRLLIETVGRMPFPAATQVLLRRAILPDSEAIRNAAADELKKRPMHAYVPQLIAMLPGSVTSKFHVVVLSGGTVLREHELCLKRNNEEHTLRFESTIHSDSIPVSLVISPQAMAREIQGAARVESQVQMAREQFERIRARVKPILERTTGFADSDDPQLWTQQYDRHYDWVSRSEPIRQYQYNLANAEGYFKTPMHERTVTRSEFMTWPGYKPSCFPRGTPVWTAMGARAIETIESPPASCNSNRFKQRPCDRRRRWSRLVPQP